MKSFISIILVLLLFACNTSEEKKEVEKPIQVDVPILNLEQANRLAKLPLHCIEIEYPNKLNQVIGSAEDLLSPKALHPAFYGCFDWHSSVHGHWTLVSLLKQFPDLQDAELIQTKLLQNISAENIKIEVAYFDSVHNSSYERTYGWAWLLKLAEELHTWDHPLARQLETNLQPLTNLIVDKYIEFLPKLNYPIRVGEHTNIAFGMSFAYDYAKTVNNESLQKAISQRAKDFFMNDKACPLQWEPSGYDFLSPCLEEAALMSRILTHDEFKTWFDEFLPQMTNENFTIDVGKVSDRTDGKLVHLDGLNFSRAWNLNTIAHKLPDYAHLKNLANEHINYSLPNLVDDAYEGGHWLGSFAIYALNTVDKD